jgi:para-aminobenzoate synthetase component 1
MLTITKRVKKVIQIASDDILKEKLLDWAAQFETFCWLDSNDYPQQYSNAEAILAVGEASKIQMHSKGSFEKLKDFQTKVADYIFGYLSYDLKNDVEKLSSNNVDELGFPDLYFFQPKKVLIVKDNCLELAYLAACSSEIDQDITSILNPAFNKKCLTENQQKIEIKHRISKQAYCKSIEVILQHINRGDVYEVNFCQEFYINDCEIDPIKTYKKLNKISKAPFSSLFRIKERTLLCASPERYLKKEGTKIISQPIKGTSKRSTSFKEDQKSAEELSKNPKERAENIMIVDLVRNDLSKLALKGSVDVEELCKVYSFKQVHQMISTIVCEVADTTHPVDIIKATFPMGSMTGAPKVAAMKIIEAQEKVKRGLYSGSVGYFTPTNDFDFNVVIRSLLYHQEKKYASYIAGGAITAKSTPEDEYNECLLKAKALSLVFSEDTSSDS